MRFLLLLATVSVAFAADPEAKVEAKEELKPEESVHVQDQGYSFSDGLELMRYRDRSFNAERYRNLGDRHYEDTHHPASHGIEDHDLPGPVILRKPGPLPHDGHPDIEAQNKIIADVYSPDYYQPTWVLDYRYLKTGGRDYTRGPGGQILILPRGVRTKEHKEFPDYDAYLEHLRLSRLSEHQHHRQHGYGDDHDRHNDRNHNQYAQGHRGYQGQDRDYQGQDRGYEGYDRGYQGHDRGHGQTLWHKYG